jgi:hypothetical protein
MVPRSFVLFCLMYEKVLYIFVQSRFQREDFFIQPTPIVLLADLLPFCIETKTSIQKIPLKSSAISLEGVDTNLVTSLLNIVLNKI